MLSVSIAYCALGLSPRVRGSLNSLANFNPCGRSIPASAGQPLCRCCRLLLSPVYPRECGAALTSPPNRSMPQGLSPRVRGSHIHRARSENRPRSIPASAGQPRQWLCLQTLHAVYPRECGAAFGDFRPRHFGDGLSPRVRGSHRVRSTGAKPMRSIPASAGQPLNSQKATYAYQVYPRECGAAVLSVSIAYCALGLSPRVRGSPARLHPSPLPCRSIPASAGQPLIRADRVRWHGVYPRECGAALYISRKSTSTRGLSPRVRGSPERTTGQPA